MKPDDLPKPDNSQKPAEHPVKYFYFLDGQKIDSDTSSLTGATIRTKLSPEKAGYAVFLESQGSEPDKQVQDADSFSIEKPPLRFYSVPPATFGKE